MLLAALAAQAEGSGGIPLSGYGQLGAVGVVLATFLWFGYKVWSSEKKRADDNAEEIKRLNTYIAEKVVPALESATREVGAASQELARRRAR